jgi:S-adenosyl-L-methionine hydrolase (adenosine-forming)
MAAPPQAPAPSAHSFITLLTDFGDHDYFVASMKGVILSINPASVIIDVSHHIAPQQIEQAGYVLHACYRYFPAGAVHVAVVDPGVGSHRRALLVTNGPHYFLAPDNGLLSRILQENADAEVRQIEQTACRRPAGGATFDGRDLFAPVAAWLTKGTPASSFGPIIHDPVLLRIPAPQRQAQRLVGRIEYVDRFGNLISNLTLRDLGDLGPAGRQSDLILHIGSHTLKGLVSSYSEGLNDQPAALINSNGRVEVFVNSKSAALQLGLAVGTEMTIDL